MSMSDVSDLLIELYKANVANAPKNQQSVVTKFRQTSPTSAESHEPSTIAAIATKGAAAVTDSKNLQRDEVVAIAAGEQQQPTVAPKDIAKDVTVGESAPFHQPTTKYTSITKAADTESNSTDDSRILPALSSIPTPVVVAPNSPQIDVKPLIHPTTGLVISAMPNTGATGATVGSTVIKAVSTICNTSVPSLAPLSSTIGYHQSTSVISGQNTSTSAPGVITSGVDVLPQAAAIAAALIRDGYNNFHQQLRTQELIKERGQAASRGPDEPDNSTANVISSKILENFLRQRRFKSECGQQNTADTDAIDGDDEDDSRYNGFDDIHLVESSKPNFNNCSASGLFHPNAAAASSSSPRLTSRNTDYLSDDSQKFMFAAQAQALRNLEYSFSDPGHNSFGMLGNDTSTPNNGNEGPEAVYECRHCGKKYRWKSTLRRHENVECGGKEPSHQCPYCPYKSKQRGNLGVHVRKHHSDLPQLTSKRRSKYSNKLDSDNNSANASDDSSSKLVIDCSK